MEGNCSTGLAAPLARRITTRRFATSVPLAGRGLKPLSVLVEATRVPGNRDTEKARTCSGKLIFFAIVPKICQTCVALVDARFWRGNKISVFQNEFGYQLSVSGFLLGGAVATDRIFPALHDPAQS